MSKISPAAQLAISFIRPFRSYLDGYMMIGSSKTKIEQDLRSRMEERATTSKSHNPDIDPKKIDYAKDCMIAMNLHFLSYHDKSYEDVLPEAIESLTVSLEKEISASFSEEEIKQIIEIVNNPLLKKLLSNNNLFGELKKTEIDLDLRIKEKMFSAILKNALGSIKDTFLDLKKKHGIDDVEEIDPEDEEPWNEDNEDKA